MGPTGPRSSMLERLIWNVADLLRGDYKQNEYGPVILPFLVLRRLDQVLAPTRSAVWEVDKKHPAASTPHPSVSRVRRGSRREDFLPPGLWLSAYHGGATPEAELPDFAQAFGLARRGVGLAEPGHDQEVGCRW